MKKRILETRAFPELLEKRNNLVEQMETLINKVKAETRALTPEESNQFNAYQEEVGKIDDTMKAEEVALKYATEQAAKQNAANIPPAKVTPEEQRSMENFLKFVRGEDLRALDVAGNGGIIPTQISSRIISRVRELSPIYARATIFQVGGDLVFPKFDYTTITTAYVADMTALTPQNGNFTTVKLSNFIAGSLVTISRSLMNRTDFDLVSFIVEQMAQSIANFLENELLNGTGTTRALGVFVDTAISNVTAASATAITFDDLLNVQMSVPEVFQPDSVWIMHKNTFAALRKLKDTTGQYLLSAEANPAAIGGFGWTLLGKAVYFSENAPSTIATTTTPIVYGDLSGLYVKLAQNIEIQTLNELYSTQHAIGVVGYVEFDARTVETQKLARLKMA